VTIFNPEVQKAAVETMERIIGVIPTSTKGGTAMALSPHEYDAFKRGMHLQGKCWCQDEGGERKNHTLTEVMVINKATLAHMEEVVAAAEAVGGVKRVQFPAGAKRSSLGLPYHLICPNSLRRLAKILDHGAREYGERNWEKGMPMEDVLNHAIDHILTAIEEWNLGPDAWNEAGEDHLGHAFCNLMFAMHLTGCKKPHTLTKEEEP